MKNILGLTGIIILLFTLTNCKTGQHISETTIYKDSLQIKVENNISITLIKGSEFNHPTYSIWAEDMQGNIINTLFITESYASGIFGHEMIGDTAWVSRRGPSYQPAALPYWTYKKGAIYNNEIIPTPEHPFVDAYSGATPQGDFTFQTNISEKESYRLYVEVNQPWDWNKYWFNNKHPNNEAYKHSAQPSMIYAATIDKEHKTYYLNPIGHGDPKGQSGKIFTNLNTITTAANIFSEIKVEL